MLWLWRKSATSDILGGVWASICAEKNSQMSSSSAAINFFLFFLSVLGPLLGPVLLIPITSPTTLNAWALYVPCRALYNSSTVAVLWLRCRVTRCFSFSPSPTAHISMFGLTSWVMGSSIVKVAAHAWTALVSWLTLPGGKVRKDGTGVQEQGCWHLH